MSDPVDEPTTLTDDEITTQRFDTAAVASVDDSDDASDTGDDSGDVADTTDTGDDSGDSTDVGDDATDATDGS